MFNNKFVLTAVTAIILHFTPFTYFQSEVQPLHRDAFQWVVFIEDQNITTHYYRNDKMNTVVFGYLPDWMLETAREHLQYNLLTHIAAYPFRVNEKGEISYPEGWPWIDILEEAKANKVKVLLTAFSEDTKIIHKLLNDEELRRRYFENLKSIVLEYELDGVNIDFEYLKPEDKGEKINNFMKELTTYLHSEVPYSEVSIAGPAVNWSGLWDLPGLAGSCDYIFVMSYCYFGKWSEYSGPAATLTGRQYCVDSTFTNPEKGYGKVVKSYPERLVMGVPYYSNYFITETSEPHSRVKKYLGHLTYHQTVQLSSKYSRIWHTEYNVPFLTRLKNGDWHQIWYDGPQSIGLKFDYAITKQLRGVGIWALGYDKDRTELWSLIDDKFSNRMPEFEDVILVENEVERSDTSSSLMVVLNEEARSESRV